jgi:hypothetical protein
LDYGFDLDRASSDRYENFADHFADHHFAGHCFADQCQEMDRSAKWYVAAFASADRKSHLDWAGAASLAASPELEIGHPPGMSSAFRHQ